MTSKQALANGTGCVGGGVMSGTSCVKEHSSLETQAGHPFPSNHGSEQSVGQDQALVSYPTS